MSKITKAHDIMVEDYLGYPELRIPMFQREYVWKVEEIEEFWSDLTQEGIQFLGSIILKDEHYDHDKRCGHLEIVDGQQRTISLLLILKTIAGQFLALAKARKKRHERNAEAHAENIESLITIRDRNDLTRRLGYKLVLSNKEDNEAFWNTLDGKQPEDKKRYKNFCIAQKKLEELVDTYLSTEKRAEEKVNKLVALKNSLLNTKVIEVLVPTDEDAYVIFETVNDRGADLGAAELLKNHLFAHLKGNQNKIDEEWQNIKRTLSEIDRKSIDVTGFLRYYWIGKYEHLTKKALFKGIKKRMNPANKKEIPIAPETILFEIGKFRTTLEKIFLYGFDDWKSLFNSCGESKDRMQIGRRAIEWFTYKQNLGYFPKSIQYLPIYAAIVGNINKFNLSDKNIIHLLLEIEKINFLYSCVLQKPTNRIDQMLSGIGRDIVTSIEKGDGSGIGRAVQIGINQIKVFFEGKYTKKGNLRCSF